MAKRKSKMELPSVAVEESNTTTAPISSEVRFVTITIPVKDVSASFETGNRKNMCDAYIPRLTYRQVRTLWMIIEAAQSEELILNSGHSAANKSNALKYLLEQVADECGL